MKCAVAAVSCFEIESSEFNPILNPCMGNKSETTAQRFGSFVCHSRLENGIGPSSILNDLLVLISIWGCSKIIVHFKKLKYKIKKIFYIILLK